MYNEHFGLRRAPFRITPDTKLFYPGGSRGEILEALIYAVTSGEGIVKVVGEVGSGKTMLCRMLEERLAGKVDIVYLANPSLSPEDTLHAIALEMKLDVDLEANRLQVMHVLQERLLDKHADNRQVVVFVEEAQSMPIATLEEIRLLSNLETNRDKLLQIVLFGQPELDENLGQPDIRQLKERITHSFYLQPFTPKQMREYVNFRMRAVGYRGPNIFRSGAYRRLAKASAGLTRRINILADKTLMAAYAENTFDVGEHHVRIAINDSQFVRTRRWGLTEVSLLSGVALVAVAVAWTFILRSDTVGERWQSILPGGAVQGIFLPEASPVTTLSRASPDAVAAATPRPPSETISETISESISESIRADSQAPASGADGERTVLAGAAGPDSAANGEAARATPAPTGGQRSDPAKQVQPATAKPAAPVADGGTRLVRANTLSKPRLEDSQAAGGKNSMAAASRDQAAAPGETTVPVGRDVGPLTEARLLATRDWLASVNDRHFSIQLLLTDIGRRDDLEKFLRVREAAGEVGDYYVFETRIGRNIWYGILYKEYASFGAATAALEELSEELRYHQPFIRNVRDIANLG